MELTMGKHSWNRRGFLKFAGLTGLGLGVGIGTKVVSAQTETPTPTGGMDGMSGMGGTAQATSAASQQMSNDEMDSMMEAGVKTFLANAGKDKDFWGVNMPFTVDGDTKVFEVTCTDGPWEVQPGNVINAMLYNGRVPGPIIRVTQGEKVRVNVTNQMTQSTAIHWHGVHTPIGMDGVPFITQPPIKPGAKFTYEFVAKNSGTHMYHSHHNAAEQVTRGLMGAFIIDPADKASEPQVSADYVLVLNDAGIGLSINGKSFPSTQPILAKKGDKIRIRYMNEGLQIHPMHLHGMYQTVYAKDGATLPIPYLADTVLVAPGERYDVLVNCLEPGAWAFHCHILNHAEASTGMFGMVTALVISEK
jgi:FtsP/CotA-like multicopper oxidase with cupredoxin domain